MNILTAVTGKRAIVVNGNLYRFIGTHLPNDDYEPAGIKTSVPEIIKYRVNEETGKKEPFVFRPAGESVTQVGFRGRGKSLHYELDLKRMGITLEKAEKGKTTMFVPFMTECNVYEDLIYLGAPYQPASLARFTAMKSVQALQPKSAMQMLTDDRVSSFIFDGRLIMGRDKLSLVSASLNGDGKIDVVNYVPAIPRNDEDQDDAIAVMTLTGWDGKLYRVGKAVYASSLEEAERLQSFLRRGTSLLNLW